MRKTLQVKKAPVWRLTGTIGGKVHNVTFGDKVMALRAMSSLIQDAQAGNFYLLPLEAAERNITMYSVCGLQIQQEIEE